MTDLKVRPSQHAPSQRVSVSSGEVWGIDFRPWVNRAPAWLPAILSRTDEIVRANLASRRAAFHLLRVLDDSLWADTPQPFVSATEDGYLSAEFCAGSIHFSIEATSSGDVSVYVADDFWDWEGSLEDLPNGGVEKWAWRISHAS